MLLYLASNIGIIFYEFGIKKSVSFLLSLLIGFNPNLIFYTNYLLADFLLAVLTTLSWLFGIKLLKNYKNKNLRYIYTVITGIFFGLAVVTKPVSILMILSLIISLAIINKLDFSILKLSFLRENYVINIELDN